MGSNGFYRAPHSQFEKDFKKLINQRESSDVEFIIGKEKKKLFAHKLILAARCELFRAMFIKNASKEIGPIVLTDVDYEAFLLMIEFLYTNSLTANSNQFEKVLYLTRYAMEYGLEDLRKICLDYLSDNMTVQNCCKIMNIATKENQQYLQEKCSKFIERNFEKVSQSKEFSSLPESALIKLLQSDRLNIRETDIIRLVHRWATQRAFENSQTVTEVAKHVCLHIRLGTLSIEELSKVEEENLSIGNMIPAELFSQAWKLHATGKRSPNDNFSRPRKSIKSEE